jgi:hypothetical protein
MNKPVVLVIVLGVGLVVCQQVGGITGDARSVLHAFRYPEAPTDRPASVVTGRYTRQRSGQAGDTPRWSWRNIGWRMLHPLVAIPSLVNEKVERLRSENGRAPSAQRRCPEIDKETLIRFQRKLCSFATMRRAQ